MFELQIKYRLYFFVRYVVYETLSLRKIVTLPIIFQCTHTISGMGVEMHVKSIAADIHSFRDVEMNGDIYYAV